MHIYVHVCIYACVYAAGPLFRVDGYNVDEVYADKRFRVAEALREAGVHHTAYARTVIRYFHIFRIYIYINALDIYGE